MRRAGKRLVPRTPLRDSAIRLARGEPDVDLRCRRPLVRPQQEVAAPHLVGGTPRRLTATRATAGTSSRWRSRDCRPRTVTRRTRPVWSCSTRSSPAAIVPSPSVPVTTVPAPRMVKDLSTQSRRRASGRGAGSSATSRSNADRRASSPAPVRADTATAGTAGEGRAAQPVAGLGQGGPGVGQVAARDDEQAARQPEGIHGGEMLRRLRTPPLVRGDDEQDRRRRTEPGEHVADEALVAGDVDEGQVLARGQRRPRVAEVDRQAATVLLGPAVGLDAGERAHEGRLAVVDVTSGRDDVHLSLQPGPRRGLRARPSRAPRPRVGGTQRRSTRQRPLSTRATTPGSPSRSGTCAGLGERDGPAAAARCRGRRRRRRARLDRDDLATDGGRRGVRCARAAHPRRRGGTRSPEAPALAASPRGRPVSACRPAARARADGAATARRRPPHRGRCRPAVRPAACHHWPSRGSRRRQGPWSRRARRAGGGPASAARCRCRATTGRARASDSSWTVAALVKPSTRKLLGCTLSTQPVSGPSAAA